MSANGSYTAGIIMIGDEILKGQIIDTNSRFLTKRLHSLGIKVCKMVVVTDDIDEIAEEVANFSKKYMLVITSGGIGPTHDDVTYMGVAKAFGENIALSTEMAELLHRFYPGKSCTDVAANPALKLAHIPLSSKLIYVAAEINDPTSVSFPVVQVNNVYILPGIPEYFEHNFLSIETLFKKTATCTFHTRQLYLQRNEFEIVSILNNAVEKYKTSVIFGSYPCLSSDFYKTKLTIESTSYDQAEDAERFLRKTLPADSVVNLPEESGMEPLYMLAKSLTSGKYVKDIRKAIQVLEECCDKYDVSQIFLSFNGGKDCTVLLHMAQAVFQKKFPDSKEKLQAVYIQSQNPFMEVEKFISESVSRYNLAITTVPGPIKNALGDILKENPRLKAVLMGTRRTDPFSNGLNSMQMTDEGWPQVMRVSPLLDWDYEFIWKYLKDFSVPYCSLYDEGYTSLGNRNNTSPNPALRYTAADGSIRYRPAYSLKDGAAERDGRH